VRAAWGLNPVERWENELNRGNTLTGKKMESIGILFPKFEESTAAKASK
jgi:hypothetical protein